MCWDNEPAGVFGVLDIEDLGRLWIIRDDEGVGNCCCVGVNECVEGS